MNVSIEQISTRENNFSDVDQPPGGADMREYMQGSHISGTLQILKQFLDADFYNSLSIDGFPEEIDQVLTRIPVSLVIILCRRHVEYLPHFLNYFHRSSFLHNNPKLYVPFLSSIVANIPIQFICVHSLLVSDARYSYQLCNSVFYSRAKLRSLPLDYTLNLESIWIEFCSLAQIDPSFTRFDAWHRLVEYRSALRTISDFKLEFNLNEFMKIDKAEIARRQLLNCQTANKLSQMLRTQVIPFCQSQGIDYDTLIVRTLSFRDWDIQTKTDIIKDFIHNPSLKDASIQSLALGNDLPTSSPPHLPRSVSCAQLKIKTPDRKRRQNGMKRSPSIDLSQMADAAPSTSLSSVANGDSEDPSEYADKLRPLRNLKEIRPIFDLAEHYNVIISLEELNDPPTRRELIGRLIEERGVSDIPNIYILFGIDPDSLIEAVVRRPSLMEQSIHIITECLPFLTHKNCASFLSFSYSFLSSNYGILTVVDSCNLLMSVLDSAIEVIDSSRATEILEKASTAKAILKVGSSEELANLLNGMNPKEIKERIKVQMGSTNESIPKNSEIRSEKFIKRFCSQKATKVASSVAILSSLSPSKSEELLKAAISSVAGFRYPRLQLGFFLLSKICDCKKELGVLDFLLNSPQSLDFHSLLLDPLSTLSSALTSENLEALLPISDILGLQRDPLILGVISKKMASSRFDDYVLPISLLTNKDSLPILLQSVAPRLCASELPKLLNEIGNSQLINVAETIRDLNALSLTDLITDKYLTNGEGLIIELYDRTYLHDKLGHQLHRFASIIASRFGLRISEVKEKIINKWLNDFSPIQEESSTSIFGLTPEELFSKADRLIVQKCCFVLFNFQPETAEKWLKSFIAESSSYRAKSRAFSCLFTILNPQSLTVADQSSAMETFYGRKFEFFSIPFSQSYMNPNSEALKRLSDKKGLSALLLELLIDINHPIDDFFISMSAKASRENPRFYLRRSLKIKSYFRERFSDVEGDFLYAASVPFYEVTVGGPRPIKFAHMTVINDAFITLAQIARPITHLAFGNELVPVPEAVRILCSCGNAGLGAELGAQICEASIKEECLRIIVRGRHFDEALSFGYREDCVFQCILETGLEQAIETMIDSHFVRFTNWLKNSGKDAELKMVKKVLKKQGRTMEIKRLKSRLKADKSQ